MSLLNKFLGRKKVKEFPPRPKWQPDLPIDVDLILETAKFYTGKKLQLAVFENGTIALFPDYIENVIEGAKSTLSLIYNSHPDFKPIAMDDGNYLIQYNQPAFSIVFKSEIENNWEYIDDHHQDGVCTDEVLIDGDGRRNVFDKIGKICLLGRARMFLDAQNPKVIKVYEP